MSYIIFDLDDTLLNNKREVTPYTLEILKHLQGMGHILVINTARSKAFGQAYLDLIRPDYSILNGGSLILDREQKEVFKAGLDVGTTQTIVRELLQITGNFSVQTEEFLFSNNGSYKGQNSKAFDFAGENFGFPSLKILAAIEDDATAKAIADKHHLEFTTYLDGVFRRYNHIDATKAKGNRKLLELLGGTLADVIAFGDDFGDVDMLNEAGIGVLMCNANPQLHSRCKYISKYTNDEDGVARFLAEHFGLEKPEK